MIAIKETAVIFKADGEGSGGQFQYCIKWKLTSLVGIFVCVFVYVFVCECVDGDDTWACLIMDMFMPYLLCICIIKTLNIEVLLWGSDNVENLNTIRSEPNITYTHTHRPSCWLVWSVTRPLLSHWSEGGVSAQRTQLPRLFIALLLPLKEKEHKGL